MLASLSHEHGPFHLSTPYKIEAGFLHIRRAGHLRHLVLYFPDYRLLEEVDRSVDNYARDKLKRITNKGEEAQPLPKVS